MQRVQMAYGRGWLEVDVPGEVTVMERAADPPLADEAEALRQALRRPMGTPPLRDLVRSTDSVAVIFSDITRPMPNDRVLPVLLAELDHVPPKRITLINALGTHRPQSEEELRRLLGPEVYGRYPVLQHDAWDEERLVEVGQATRGYPWLVNRAYVEADVRILTGFVEPHFFAGFSGGPKAVLPGVAGVCSIMRLHDYGMVSHPNATWLQADGNPMYAEIEAAALATQPTFTLNVTLDRDKRLSGVYAGEMLAVHRAAREAVGRSAVVPVQEPFDVLLTGNGGYPLDLNLYQAVKGMSAAARVTRPGGAIVMVAECWDGVPEHGRFAEFITSVPSPQALLEHIAAFTEPVHDQWQAQVLAQLLLQADIYVHAEGLGDEMLEAAMLGSAKDLGGTLAQLVRERGSRVAVLPEGPFVVPTLA